MTDLDELYGDVPDALCGHTDRCDRCRGLIPTSDESPPGYRLSVTASPISNGEVQLIDDNPDASESWYSFFLCHDCATDVSLRIREQVVEWE